MGRKVAVILSGCGHTDGSEIHETVLSYLALEEAGFEIHSFAPDRDAGGKNLLKESAKIARGEISPLKDLDPKKYDVLWFPGGFGVTLHLSDFAKAKEKCQTDPEVDLVIQAFFAAKKPIVAVCIAPVLLASSLRGKGVKLTLGSDPSYLGLLALVGAKGVLCKSDEICIDEAHHIYTTPAYMEAPNLKNIYKAVSNIANHLKETQSARTV